MVHVFTQQSKEGNNMDLYSMIQNGAHFKVEVTSEDLVTFADRLITKSQEIKAMELANNPDEEKWLTAEEAAKMCRVCATTLWSWAKSGYLVPAKMGRQRLFALSDIQKILNDRARK